MATVQPRLAPLLADMFSAFASPEAQANGVTFDREMTAIWAEALLETTRVVHEMEHQTALLREALAMHRGAQVPPMTSRPADVIDLRAAIARRRAQSVAQDGAA